MSETSADLDLSLDLVDRNPEADKILLKRATSKYELLPRGFEKEAIPLSEDQYSKLAFKYRENMLEEMEGVEPSEGGTPIYEFVTASDMGSKNFEKISKRAATLVDTLKGANSKTFSNTYDMLGALGASLYPQESQTGVDQRKVWTALSSTSDYRIGKVNDAFSDFLKSPQASEDFEFFFMQILAEDTIVRQRNSEFLSNTSEQLDKVSKILGNLYPDTFQMVELDSITFVSYISDIQKLNLYGNLNFPQHGYGAGASAQAIVSDLVLDKGEKIHITAREPYSANENIANDKEKRILRFNSMLIHESIHGNKSVGPDFRFGTPHEIALELITDYGTLIAFNKAGIGKKSENGKYEDWVDKTAYYPFIKLAQTLTNQEIFGEKLLTDDQILEFGVNQDWKGFISEVDRKVGSLSPNQKQAFIDELDRRLIIGPDEYEDLKNQEQLSFDSIGKSMLGFSQKIGGQAYFMIGILIDSISVYVPELEDKSVTEEATYFMGPKENPQISPERRAQKHELIRRYLNRAR